MSPNGHEVSPTVTDVESWISHTANPHVLVVAPDLSVGLTHEQLDRVEEWLG